MTRQIFLLVVVLWTGTAGYSANAIADNRCNQCSAENYTIVRTIQTSQHWAELNRAYKENQRNERIADVVRVILVASIAGLVLLKSSEHNYSDFQSSLSPQVSNAGDEFSFGVRWQYTF